MIQTDDRIFLAGVTAGYVAVSLSLILSWPLLWPDEAIFADTARNVLLSGHPSTTFVAGMESGAYWQPPGWFYVMAPVIGVFGYDILPLRIACMLIGAGILWATFALGRELGVSGWVSRCALVFLAFNPNFVTYVKLVRMDGLCVLFTLLGLIAYARSLKGAGRRGMWAASLLFTAAVLTHPLGILGPAIAGSHVLCDGRIDRRRTAFTLIGVALSVGTAAAVWFISAGNHSEAMRQIAFQMERKTRPFPAPVFSFVERYRSIPLFGLLIPASLIWTWLRLRRFSPAFPMMLAIGATISTFIAAAAFEVPYHLYCLPFLTLASSGLISQFRHSSRGGRRMSLVITVAVLCNFSAYFLFFNYEFLFNLRSETNYQAFTAKIAEELPKDATVCIAGYPCVYWGLNRMERGYKLFDETFITDSLGIDLARRAGWLVVTNGFSPEDDRPDVQMQIKTMTDYAARAGRMCIFKDFIGARERFSYTARIFQIVQAADRK